MSESLNAQTTWRDVKANTFRAFVQFGYTGDCSAPAMILQELKEPYRQPDADEQVKAEAPLPEDDFGWEFTASRKDRKRQKEKASPSPFESRTYTLIEPRSKFEKSCDPILRRGSTGNIHEILWLHASLCVLADKWAVDGLKRLSLVKPHKSLTLLELNVGAVPDIVGLVRYVYSDENSALDELRDLICHFVSVNATIMSEDVSFRELLEEGGAFALDSWRYAIFNR
jgi:hypothetical protein